MISINSLHKFSTGSINILVLAPQIEFLPKWWTTRKWVESDNDDDDDDDIYNDDDDDDDDDELFLWYDRPTKGA